MKLKSYYRIDNQGEPVLASNIKRYSLPRVKGERWKQLDNFCCNTPEISCTCDFRYFVQTQKDGTPIDHTIIKRLKPPTTGDAGIIYKEIQWQDPCCLSSLVNVNFNINNTTGSFVLKINGATIYTFTDTVTVPISFRPVVGSIVEVTLVNDCSESSIETNISITSTTAPTITNPDNSLGEVVTSFTVASETEYTITAELVCVT